VYALNASDGAKLWNYNAGGMVASSPAVAGGIVYIGSWNDNFYALNASIGSQLWNYTTGDVVGTAPVVVGNVVYVGSNDYNLYAFNTTNGAKFWNFTSDGVAGSPAFVDDVIYYGGGNDVYALGDSHPSASPSSSNTLPIVVGVAAAVIVGTAILLASNKLKTKPKNPYSRLQSS
jgi:outer membrane protein assembly factor BamB